MNNHALSDQEIVFWMERCDTIGDLLTELAFSKARPEAPITPDIVRLGYAFLLDRSDVSPDEALAWLNSVPNLGALRAALLYAENQKKHQ